MKPNWHYYEAHIELAPINQADMKLLEDDLRELQFDLVDLVAIRREDDLNLITTYHSTKLPELKEVVRGAVKRLKQWGYTVKRYKIESTVLDSKHDDSLALL